MTPNKLPPLPELPPHGITVLLAGNRVSGYTADQMHTYAAEALRQSQSLPAGAVAGLVHSWRQSAHDYRYVADAREKGEAVKVQEWEFCPECGCSKVRFGDGESVFCADCGQEWFRDMNYVECVRRNLSELYRGTRISAPRTHKMLLAWERGLNDGADDYSREDVRHILEDWRSSIASETYVCRECGGEYAGANSHACSVEWRTALTSCLRLLDIPGVAMAAAGHGVVQARHDARQALATQPAQASEKDEVSRLREALESIRQYGADTLSGRMPSDGPDDRQWQRDAVKEMTKRAREALATSSQESASE